MEQKKILITGATGFTGSALAKKLVEQGHLVRSVVRNRSKVTFTTSENFEIVEGSIVDENIVNTAMKGIDLVYHIAAVFREPGITDKVYWDVHVKATENLLNSALKHGVKKFVHCSTGGVHGHIEKPPANEEYRFSPGDIYQVTKLEGEKKAFEFHKSTGLPVVVIRPAPIYGPGDLRLVKLFRLAKKKYTILLGSGEVFYHMVYIDDLVDAFILASEKENAVGEAFIIGGGETLTLNHLIDVIADVLRCSKNKIHLPAGPFQAAGSICEKIFIPLGLNPPIYRRRVDFFTKSRSFDISKAKRVLGYSPKINITEGIKRTAEWYQKNGLL